MIKALLFTILLFALTFVLVALPVLFGGIGAICLLGVVFLIIFIAVFFSL